MKLYSYTISDFNGAESWQEYYFWCPGCKCCHSFRVGAKGRPSWVFDGNTDSPTFSGQPPFSSSLRLYTIHPETKAETTLCHLNLTAGKLIFHGDSSHELKGQTVDLPEIPENYGLPGKYCQTNNLS